MICRLLKYPQVLPFHHRALPCVLQLLRNHLWVQPVRDLGEARAGLFRQVLRRADHTLGRVRAQPPLAAALDAPRDLDEPRVEPLKPEDDVVDEPVDVVERRAHLVVTARNGA